MIKVHFKNGFKRVMTTKEFTKLDKSKIAISYPWNFGDSPDDWIPHYE